MRRVRSVFLIVVGFLVASCGGTTRPLSSGAVATMKGDSAFAPDIPIARNAVVAVSVVDHRSYVLAGTKSPRFEGLLRNFFGVVYSAETPTEQPLSTALEELIAAGLERRSKNVDTLSYVKPGTPLENVKEGCVRSKSDMCIVMLLREWKYDIWKRVRKLEYDTDVMVYDGVGQMLGTKTFTATVPLD